MNSPVITFLSKGLHLWTLSSCCVVLCPCVCTGMCAWVCVLPGLCNSATVAPATALCPPVPPSLTGPCLSLGPHSHRPVFSRTQETLAFSLVKATGQHVRRSGSWMPLSSMATATGRTLPVTLRRGRQKVRQILGKLLMFFRLFLFTLRTAYIMAVKKRRMLPSSAWINNTLMSAFPSGNSLAEWIKLWSLCWAEGSHSQVLSPCMTGQYLFPKSEFNVLLLLVMWKLHAMLTSFLPRVISLCMTWFYKDWKLFMDIPHSQYSMCPLTPWMVGREL